MALLTNRAYTGNRSTRTRARERCDVSVRLCRKLCVGILVSIGLALGECPAQTAIRAAEYTEYQIKAAFLFNFAKFVDWPAEVFPDTTTPITIGIFGKDPFGGTLEEIVAGETVRGRRLALVRFRRVRDIRDCHILFVSASEERSIPQILDKVRGTSVLTVGEIENFARDGGIVNFVLRESRVRFQVNMDAADRARLRISSKLLKLAEIVRENRR